MVGFKKPGETRRAPRRARRAWGRAAAAGAEQSAVKKKWPRPRRARARRGWMVEADSGARPRAKTEADARARHGFGTAKA